MSVVEAVKYVKDAFKTFLDECDKARASEVSEDEIFVCATNPSSKSIASKLFSCLICDN